MLKPALLYKEELEKKDIATMDDLSKMWWHGNPYRYTLQIGENTDKNYGTYDYACVNNKNEVIGFFSYFIDWQVRMATSFCVVSYMNKPNIILVKDCINKITSLFNDNGMQKITWRSYADNPFIKSYRKFIKRHGGREVGIERRHGMLEDGKLHDSVIFEILKEDYKP